jgi:hypothetical protein
LPVAAVAHACQKCMRNVSGCSFNCSSSSSSSSCSGSSSGGPRTSREMPQPPSESLPPSSRWPPAPRNAASAAATHACSTSSAGGTPSPLPDMSPALNGWMLLTGSHAYSASSSPPSAPAGPQRQGSAVSWVDQQPGSISNSNNNNNNSSSSNKAQLSHAPSSAARRLAATSPAGVSVRSSTSLGMPLGVKNTTGMLCITAACRCERVRTGCEYPSLPLSLTQAQTHTHIHTYPKKCKHTSLSRKHKHTHTHTYIPKKVQTHVQKEQPKTERAASLRLAHTPGHQVGLPPPWGRSGAAQHRQATSHAPPPLPTPHAPASRQCGGRQVPLGRQRAMCWHHRHRHAAGCCEQHAVPGALLWQRHWAGGHAVATAGPGPPVWQVTGRERVTAGGRWSGREVRRGGGVRGE